MNDLTDSKVLVVDDTEANLDILVGALGDLYDIYVAIDGESALDVASSELPDLILLDVMMPGMDGFEVCTRLKSNERTRHIPVVFITALSEPTNKAEGFRLGAVDYIQKPFEIMEVKARVKTHIMLSRATRELEKQNEKLESMVRERTLEISMTQEATIESLANLAEYRDPETGGHIKRTQSYILVLAMKLRDHPRFKDFLSGDNIELLTRSAPLHDIGKVGVPDYILLKEGRLSPEEQSLMEKHTIYGHNTILSAEKRLGSNSFLRIAREIAYSHHEKWDGSGYPRSLKGNAIPISGRLMAIADVYDALISKRVYKPSLPHEEALHIMTKGDNRTLPGHFDPDVLKAFVESESKFHGIATEFSDFSEDQGFLFG